MAGHQVIEAPMGTVFPISAEAWAELVDLLQRQPPGPEVVEDDASDVPPAPVSWAERRKDTYPLPGGNEGQLHSLAAILQHIQKQRPSIDDLAVFMRDTFGSSETNARLGALFIRRAGFADDHAGRLQVSHQGQRFLETGDGAVAVAQLHSRVRFIGELLRLLDLQPRTVEEILNAANQLYAAGWTTSARILRRRGWLQSAGMVDLDGDRRLYLTEPGRTLAKQLNCHPPDEPEAETSPSTQSATAPSPIVETTPAEQAEPAPTTSGQPEWAQVARWLEASAIAGNTPDDFEEAVGAAFKLLGFRAERLGGAGQTDVVADAELGRDASFRVIIDGKTTARGAVSDHQIDWVTLNDHRRAHMADFVAVVGPAFQGDRLKTRAADHEVTLLTATDLAGLVQQHADLPLILDDYRTLFAEVGEADLSALSATAEQRERILEITLTTLAEIENTVSDVGALSARDLYLLLRGSTDLAAGEGEIEECLRALSSLLLAGLIEEDEDGNYRPTAARSTIADRLRRLADRIEHEPGNVDS